MAAGWQLYRLSPGMWTLLVFASWLLIALVKQVPYLGALASIILVPVFTMSFMAMCEELRHGRRLRANLLFAGFRTRLVPLLVLGALYLFSILATLWLSSLADGGTLMNWLMWGRLPDQTAWDDGRLFRGILIASAIATPVLAAFWFAPLLVAWDGMSAGKSLFYSFFGCMRNWRPFFIYGLVLALLVIGFSVLISIAALGSGSNRGLLSGLFIAYVLMLTPTTLASFYVAYRDVFPEAPAEPPLAGAAT